MQPLILIVHVLTCLCLVVLVLLQHGKGADIGAAFGSGASNTMFGSVGATSFLMKMTVALATLFFITSLSLGYLAAHVQKQYNLNSIPNPSVPSVPASPPYSQ